MTTRPVNLAPPAYPYPDDHETAAWAEWQARLDAAAAERPVDPVIDAQLRANDALFRRRAADAARAAWG